MFGLSSAVPNLRATATGRNKLAAGALGWEAGPRGYN